MPSWIYSLSDDGILASMLVAIVGATAAALVFTRHVLRYLPSPDTGGVVVDASRAVMSLTALVLAFSLVEAQLSLRSLRLSLQREASVLVSIDRASVWAGDPGEADLRARLATYARALLTDEWPQLNTGQRSTSVDSHYTALSVAIQAVKPSNPQQLSAHSELLKGLRELSDLREAGVASASTRCRRSTGTRFGC